jgi:hypothetical protein
MNPKYTDSLFESWLRETHKPHMEHVRRVQRERRTQRISPVLPWQFTEYPVQAAPRYPLQESVQVVTPLSTIDPKVR